MSYQRGEIVLVPFPFTDLSRQKARPAIVLSPSRLNQRSPDVILAAISSKVPTVPNEFEWVLHRNDSEFAITGLRVSSVVKANKLITIKQSLIYRVLGKVSDQALRELDRRVARAIGLGASKW